MTTQPEALRLADALDAHEFDEPHAAAAELRRLHAENRALTDALFQAQEAAKALLAQRDALLEALKELTGHVNERFSGGVWDRARAAIKAVEGEKK